MGDGEREKELTRRAEGRGCDCDMFGRVAVQLSRDVLEAIGRR